PADALPRIDGIAGRKPDRGGRSGRTGRAGSLSSYGAGPHATRAAPVRWAGCIEQPARPEGCPPSGAAALLAQRQGTHGFAVRLLRVSGPRSSGRRPVSFLP